jgi:membrane-associated protease RseP (regulator of RpoE activity)
VTARPRDKESTVSKQTLAVITALVTALALPLAAAVVMESQDAPDDGEVVRHRDRVVVRAVTGDGEEGGDGKVRVFVVSDGDEAGEHRRFEVDVAELAAGEQGVRIFRAGPGGPFGHLAGRGFLGIQLIEVTPELAAHLGAAGEGGVLVGRVEEGSPAELAGVRVGDLLTHVDGQTVESGFDVMSKVRPMAAGQVVGLEVVRDGRLENLSATVVEREPPRLEAGTLIRRLGEEGEGFTWEVDPAELSKRMEKVTEYFASPEWKAHVEELEASSRTMEERLEQLERELREMERRLAETEP